MKRILITGGNGFIGQHLSRLLVQNDYAVTTMDMWGGYKEKGINKITGNVLDKHTLNKATKNTDMVVHMAAMMGVKNTERNRIDTLDVNILGTKNLLESCVKNKVKKVLLTSSSEVYGNQNYFPVSEENPLNPKSVYAVTKLAGEEYVKAYCQDYNMDYNIVRYHNAYGEEQNQNFVIPRFIKKVLNNEPPLIYGTGEQIRCFCYIQDIIQGTYEVLSSEDATNKTFNVGNDREPITMLGVANKIIQLCEKDIEPMNIGMEKSDRTRKREIYKRVPDISHIKEITGFEPQYNLNVGLHNTIEWWRKTYCR